MEATPLLASTQTAPCPCPSSCRNTGRLTSQGHPCFCAMILPPARPQLQNIMLSQTFHQRIASCRGLFCSPADFDSLGLVHLLNSRTNYIRIQGAASATRECTVSADAGWKRTDEFRLKLGGAVKHVLCSRGVCEACCRFAGMCSIPVAWQRTTLLTIIMLSPATTT